MVIAAALWTGLVVIEPLVRVAGGSGCPAPVEVEARLEVLLPAAPAPIAADVATLEERGDRVRVTLRRADGATLGQRELDRSHACDDLAAAIALVVAGWESDVHPEFVSTLPAGARVAPPRPGRSTFDVGGAVAASTAPAAGAAVGQGLAAMGMLVAGWIPATGRPGARIALGASTERALPVGSGEARWRRLTAAFGSQIRWGRAGGTAMVDVHAALLATALSLRGSGFSINQQEWVPELGAGAGARLWLGRAAGRVWLEVGMAVWPRQHSVYQGPEDGARASVPRAEILLALGFGFMGPNADLRAAGD